MSGCVRSALGVLVLAVGLAGSACGRYGPPVRASERAMPAEERRERDEDLPAPITDPTVDLDDPVVPGEEP
jgi:hypothetical protein